MSLASFVPPLALSILSDAPIPEDGCRRACAAAALFVDISGFTRLADVVTTRFGDKGAERLQDILNAGFAPIVDAVERADGQVLAFPGDAALCLWPVPDESASLVEATLRAAECALHLRERLSAVPTIDGIPLRFRAVVAAGAAGASMAGGLDGRWALLVTGAPIQQLAAVRADSGQVVLSTAAAALSRRWLLGRPHPSGWLLTNVAPWTRTILPRPAATPPDEVIAPLVADSVRVRMQQGHDSWMAEFRIVTVMFVVFADHTNDDALHSVVRTVQTIVRRFEGDLNQAVVDDKGLTLVIAFGLFQQAHEDDAVRALEAARAMVEALLPTHRIRVGIATGRVFTGIRGGASRREFALIGDSVVLAARLAGVADPILCDAATHAKATQAFRFDQAGPFALKGKDGVTAAWQPREPAGTFSGPDDADASEAETAGTDPAASAFPAARQTESALIEQLLGDLADLGRGVVVVISGEPGIGKSALTRTARRVARRFGVTWVAGRAESIHASTTLHAWRPIVAALLTEEARANARGRSLTEQLVALLGEDESEWLPLLNPVLREQLAETDRTAPLTAESRTRATRHLLGALLRRLSNGRKLVVAIEDTHWLDSFSWDVIDDVIAQLPHVLLLLTARLTPDTETRVARLRGGGGFVDVPLSPLTPDEISGIVARRIGAARLAEPLSQWIDRRCEGNPLFAQELAVMLLERRAVEIVDGVCDFGRQASEQDLVSLPTSVQSVLAVRIDRLPVDEQLAIKVASVFGRSFDVGALAAISPIPDSTTSLEARLDRIAAAGLVQRSTQPRHMVFSHALVQEAAYNLLPFAHRRILHQSAAQFIEGQQHVVDPAVVPLLAHHWELAEVPVKAIAYLERAGEHALLNASSHAEAEQFLKRLIAIGRQHAKPEYPAERPLASAESRAKWERLFAQAVARQGRHEEALAHLENGLSLLHRPMPGGSWTNKIEAARGVVTRLLIPVPSLRTEQRQDDACLEAMRLYDNVIQLLYLGQAGRQTADGALRSTVALLRAAELGERAGECAELSTCYSMLANLIAMLRRRQLALQYAERARQVAADIGDKQALFRALTIGQLPSFIFGRWDEAESRLLEGVALGGILRNVYETLIAECTLGHIALHRDRLKESASRFEAIGRRSQDAKFTLPELWALAGLAEVRLREERLDEAIDAAESCLVKAERESSSDQNSRFQAYGILASARARRREWTGALGAVQPAMLAAKSGAYLSFSSSAGFVGVSEALLGAWDAEAEDAARCKSQLRQWMRQYRVAAFCRPILDPGRLNFRAAWHMRQGHEGRARKALLASLRKAEELAMPYEVRRAQRALATADAQVRGKRSSASA